MKKTVEVYLEDILSSISKIEAYIKDMDFSDFYKDTKTHDAVIRNLEIVGEAMNRLPEEFFIQYPSFPSKEAIAMRNFLIHDYGYISLETVWKTIQSDIPQLKEDTITILSEQK